MAATLSYQGDASVGGGGSTLSFTVASAAGQERLVALCSITNDYINAFFGGVSIDGQTATQVGPYVRAKDSGAGPNGPIVSFWRAAGTSGTNINVTFGANGLFDTRGYIWTLSNAGTLLASTSATVSNPVSTVNLNLNVDTATNGAVAAAVLFYNTSTQAVSWTGVTERFQGHNLYGSDQDSAADANIGSASTPLTVSANFGAGDFTSSGTQALVGLAVSFNPVTTGTTLTAAAGSYAVTGSAAGLVVGGNVTLAADPGSYRLTGSDAVLPQPFVAGGYTGGASRGRMIRKFRKREEQIEELIELVQQPAQQPAQQIPQVPQVPQTPPPRLIDLVPKMQAVGLTLPQQKIVKRAVVTNDPDDDDEAIELLLNLLS